MLKKLINKLFPKPPRATMTPFQVEQDIRQKFEMDVTNVTVTSIAYPEIKDYAFRLQLVWGLKSGFNIDLIATVDDVVVICLSDKA